ncbi:MAG: transposase [Verrucomicrobiota bacterium]|nr:transposase [Verrucomicrobiota bacterium]
MGERHGWLFEPTFNRSIKIRQADPRITSDAGALLLREVDHRLGLTADLAAELFDPRDPVRIRYTQTELLRQHLYGLARQRYFCSRVAIAFVDSDPRSNFSGRFIDECRTDRFP